MTWTFKGMDAGHIGYQHKKGFMDTAKGQQLLPQIAVLADLAGQSSDTIQLFVTQGSVQVDFFGPTAAGDKQTNSLCVIGKHTWGGVSFQAYRPANMDLSVEEGAFRDKADLLGDEHKEALMAIGRALEFEGVPALRFERAPAQLAS